MVTIAAVLGAFAFFGLTPFKLVVTKILGTTTQGGTGNIARQYNVYGVNLGAPGSNATTSSIYNGTGNDLFVTHVIVGCQGVGTSKTAYTGAGLASLTVYAATTSTSNPANVTNANKVGGGNLVIGTSTAQFMEASSTSAGLATGLGGSNLVNNIWPASSYMTFTTNATNTAVCTFGVGVTSS